MIRKIEEYHSFSLERDTPILLTKLVCASKTHRKTPPDDDGSIVGAS
jgi:hypothetical protein